MFKPYSPPQAFISDWVLTEAEVCQRHNIEFRAFTDGWFYYYPDGSVIVCHAPARGQTTLVEALRLTAPNHAMWLNEARRAFTYVTTRTH